MKCPRSRRVLDRLATCDVSASGLSFTAPEPHGLEGGEYLEVQLVARTQGTAEPTDLALATRAVVIRADRTTGALRFHAPLAY